MSLYIPEKVAGAKTAYEPGLNKPGTGIAGRYDIPEARMDALVKITKKTSRRDGQRGSIEHYEVFPPREETLFNPSQIASHQAPIPVAITNPNATEKPKIAGSKLAIEQLDNVTAEELAGHLLAQLMDKSTVTAAAREARDDRKVIG